MTSITAENDDSDVIGHRIVAGAQEKPMGLSNDDLIQLIPEINSEQRVNAINKLLQQGVLEILTKNKNLIYRLKDPAKKDNIPKGTDNEERIVYSIIEDGGNKGIWVREIRNKSNLIMTQLNKILKNLENKKLIKAVKAVNVCI